MKTVNWLALSIALLAVAIVVASFADNVAVAQDARPVKCARARTVDGHTEWIQARRDDGYERFLTSPREADTILCAW